MKNTCLLIAAATLAATLGAQEHGDAPASYGLMRATLSSVGTMCYLGSMATDDTTNPVTPAWTGDQDDGIVGTPFFDSWSSTNTLTVRLGGEGHLVLFVDANDDGMFSVAETYVYSPTVQEAGDYTFSNISIHATSDFSLNGTNKVAVRIVAQNNLGGGPNTNPYSAFWYGEVEDWLIDVEPAKFAVVNETLRDATEGVNYGASLQAENGTPPYSWSMSSGSLPTGVSLTQAGDIVVLSGQPAQGSGAGLPSYTFTVTCVDSLGLVATRSLDLAVWPPPVAAPFEDDFSADRGWRLEGSWARLAAAPHQGTGANYLGVYGSDPGEHRSQGSDNMMLADTPQASFPASVPQPLCAISPKVDCRNLATVQLQFYRWLSFGNNDDVAIEVTNDGVNWTTVWEPLEWAGWAPSTHYRVADPGWTLCTYDISAVAVGQRRVQVRFSTGPVNSSYTAMYGPAGFNGWNIDDLRIGEGPATLNASAGSFTVQGGSGVSTQSTTLPLMYPQSSHAWSVTVTNNGSTDLLVDRADVALQVTMTSGVSGNPHEVTENDGWFNGPSWVLTAPVTVPANGSAVVQGVYNCPGVPGNLWLVPMDATVIVQGADSSGVPFSLTDTMTLMHNYGPQPGLFVYEQQAGTTQIQNGAIAANLRDFGSVATGNASAWLNIVLKNTSGNSLTLGTPVLSGPDAGDFSLYVAQMVSPLPGGGGASATTWFSVRFSPGSTGVKNATVSFTHNAPNTGDPFTFEVRGTGVTNSPIMLVTEGSTAGPPVGNNQPPTGGRDFGQLAVSATSAPLQIHIQNTGALPLDLGVPMLAGSHAADFQNIASGFPLAVSPGASVVFELLFQPGSTGVKDARVEWTHNDPGQGSPFSFDIRGVGIVNAPVISVHEGNAFGPVIAAGAPAGGQRLFGPYDVATTSQWVTIVVRNDGWQDLQLGTPVLTGTHVQDFAINTNGINLTLQPGSQTSFQVAFAPIAKGAKSATVSFSQNDPSVSAPFTFGLAGAGVDPNGVAILSTNLPAAQVDELYVPYQIPCTGGTTPYTWSIVAGALPAGISLGGDGVLSGVPTSAPGYYSFSIRVEDALGGDETRQMSLLVIKAGSVAKDTNSAAGGCASHGSKRTLPLIALLALCALVFRRRHVKRQLWK